MTNFKQGRDREYKYYHALTDDDKAKYPGRDFTHIRVSIEYSKGGTNWFSGGTYPRGYRVSTRPVTLAVTDAGFTSEGCILLGNTRESGGYLMIEAAARYNAGRLGVLAAIYDDKVQEIAQATIDGNLRSLITMFGYYQKPAEAQATA